jgi:hypothetical protein
VARAVSGLAGWHLTLKMKSKCPAKKPTKTAFKMTFGPPIKDVQFVVRFRSIFGQCSPEEVLAEFEAHSQPRALLEPSSASFAASFTATFTATSVSAKVMRGTTCNIKNVSVTAFFECNDEAGGGDAASRRCEEIDCNITSTL